VFHREFWQTPNLLWFDSYNTVEFKRVTYMDEVTFNLLFLFTVLRHREESEMRQNINNTRQLFGNQTERGIGAQMLAAIHGFLSLSVERLCRFIWSVFRSIYANGVPAMSRANPKGIAGMVTKRLRTLVDAAQHVPSLGTDQAYRRGLTAS